METLPEVVLTPVSSRAGFTWPAVELPPQLASGFKAIDDEHRMLLACVANVRRVCDDLQRHADCTQCGAACRSQCESTLVNLLGDLFAFILEHFCTEERVMRESLMLMVDRDVCEAHMADHAALAAKVQDIVARLDDAQTVDHLRALDDLLGRWIHNHILLHDVLMARWLRQRTTQGLVCRPD